MIYCYKLGDTGEILDMDFPMGKAPQEIVIHSELPPFTAYPPPEGISPSDVKYRRACRSLSAEHKSVPPTKGWPIECIGTGVNAADAGKLRDELASKGVPTEVTSDGNPVYRDSRHRKRALKARGMFDRSSYL